MDAYEFAVAGKEIERVKATPAQAAVAKLPVGSVKPVEPTCPAGPAKPWVKREWKK
jgi:hypothetical protein